MPLDWPVTSHIKSCGLSTEFLASNSANGVHSVSGIKLKAEDLTHHSLSLRQKTQVWRPQLLMEKFRGQHTICWVGGQNLSLEAATEVRGKSNSLSHLPWLSWFNTKPFEGKEKCPICRRHHFFGNLVKNTHSGLLQNNWIGRPPPFSYAGLCNVIGCW